MMYNAMDEPETLNNWTNVGIWWIVGYFHVVLGNTCWCWLYGQLVWTICALWVCSKKYIIKIATCAFLAGLQSNSGLWIDAVRLSVCPSVCPSVNIWLTSAFKFVLGHINQYRLDTLHVNRPWWDLLNCDLSLWPWPSLFLFKVA